MRHSAQRICWIALLAIGTLASANLAEAAPPWTKQDWLAARRASQRPWHGAHYHTATGQPVALVVPPTANVQTNWSWGVGQTTMTPIDHQFQRPYPGPFYQLGADGVPFIATPRWPSHTDQFGIYSVRGPW